MAEESNILVVGSINMDLVVRVRRMPEPSQTVSGEDFTHSPGGKGANQAVAAARLGGRVQMVGCLGDDEFGRVLKAGLEAENVDTAHILLTDQAPTGVAMIVVDSSGENSIVVAGGANLLLTPDDLYSHEYLFEAAAVVLLQLELPLPTVRTAIVLARRHGTKIILDPAPMPKNFCDELYRVDIITPNVTEAEALADRNVQEERVDKAAASMLIARGAQAAVIKLGPRGSLTVCANGNFYRVPPYKVNVQDTTGAGDAFNAALAVAIRQGRTMHEAAMFANAAGALTCTKLGAQAAMPAAIEVKMLMDDQAG